MSIWSVTFIEAISAVKAEPIRAVIIIAVKTGHNSRKYVTLNTAPNILVVFKNTNSFPICKVNTILIKQAVIKTIVKESIPTDIN